MNCVRALCRLCHRYLSNGAATFRVSFRTALLRYSKIPLLRPPKVKTNSTLKSIFKKLQSFILCVFCTQCFLERDHLWNCSKVVLKTTFEQSQKWSYYRNFTVIITTTLKHVFLAKKAKTFLIAILFLSMLSYLS